MSLFEGVQLGELALDNRAVFRPVRTRLVENGRPTDALGAHFAARAAGGAGLVVGPADMLVHASASGPAYIDAYREGVVDDLAGVVEAVHDAGSPIIGQLTHPGGEETGDWEMQEQLAPAAVPSDAAYEMPRAMTHEEIESVRDGFVTAAEHLECAGFDGVELAANAFSVLRQFLSPRFNTREDEYGGDWRSRARFLNEVLRAVGDAVDGPVGLHLSLSELVYGGYGFEDVTDILDALSGVEYLSCTVGTRSTFNRAHAGIADEAPPLVDGIKTAVSTTDAPVMGRAPFTGITDTDRLFNAGVDFVCFTRQLLADPATVNAAAAGRSFDRCIECNQKCLEGVYGHAHGGHVECVINPQTGREHELPPVADVPPAPIPHRILVVGGGAAGLRFATVAAERGHDVTLREADKRLGGQLTTAAQGILKPFERALEDLVRAVEEADITVERDTRVTPEAIDSSWDVIVVSTGATRPDPPSDAFRGPVVDAFDVLEGADIAEDVLLYDDNRWIITHQTAQAILDQGATLEIVTRDHYPGFRTEQPNVPGLIASLQERGTTATKHHALKSVSEDGTVTIRNTLTGETDTRHPEQVVVAGRRRADEDLYHDLRERFDEVYRIGDAVAPRKLDRAYYDGEMLARRL